MIGTQLTVEGLPPQSPVIQTPGLISQSTSISGINWPLVAIVVGGLIIIIWYIAAHRAVSNSPKPPPARSEKRSRAKICHDCGKPMDKEDKFCGKCGTEL